MDPSVTALRGNAELASSDAAKLTESIPGLLSGLKTNLNSIFTRDNPEFAQRESALTNFLNTPSQTRAELLPSNQPVIAGLPLNYSPTAQEAMVTARSNAAMVPLAGLNQSIVGQYGNLADMLQSAGGIYSTQATAAQNKAVNALNLYKAAVDEYNAVTARNKAGEGGGGINIFGGDYGYGTDTGTGTGEKPPIESFETPDTHEVTIPGQGPGTINLANVAPSISQPYTPPENTSWASQLGNWWNNLWGGPRTIDATNPNTSLNILAGR